MGLPDTLRSRFVIQRRCSLLTVSSGIRAVSIKSDMRKNPYRLR